MDKTARRPSGYAESQTPCRLGHGNRTRILVLNERDPLHPRAGGAEVHILEIARRMEGMGYSTTLAASSFPDAPSVERLSGLTVWRLGRLGTYYPRVVGRCARATRQAEFDVVVEHLNKIPFFSPLYSRAPVLAVSHHLFGRSAFMQVSWPIAAGVVSLEKMIPLAYRKTPFVAVSESSRDDLVRRGIAEENVRIIHNGISAPKAVPLPLARRNQRIAYLGRLEPYKRVDLLLQAVSVLARKYPAIELVIIGRGSHRPRLETVASDLGLLGRVRFTEFISDGERDHLLASSRVCVCPSVKEGWGITVIEANATGTPVIATDAPGLRDAVQHERTGILVQDGEPGKFAGRLADALERVLRDDDLADRLARGAIAWAAKFTWEAAAQTMAEAVEQAKSESRWGRKNAPPTLRRDGRKERPPR